MVIWLIGLSASGKTTIGRELQSLLDGPKQRWLLVDGDAFREVMGGDTGHDLGERRKNAYRISRLCRFLELQQVNVIACVLSLFPDNRDFNRTLFSEYREVYVKVPMKQLRARDNKNIYARAQAGEITHVAGMDLEFPEPSLPDFVLDNTAETRDFRGLAKSVALGLRLSIEKNYAYPRSGAQPEKYQYTAFEGEEFFDRFRHSRQRAIAALDAKITQLEAIPREDAETHPLAELLVLGPAAGFWFRRELQTDGASAADLLRTRDFLCRYLTEPIPEDAAYVTSLLRRFEVNKVVYDLYRLPEWRKAPEAHADFLGAILLSIALLVGLPESPPNPGPENTRLGKWVDLNAVFKLNDLIAARQSELATPSELWLARAALNLERIRFERWKAVTLA